MPERPDEASKLARLLGEIEELEKSRVALLVRVERLRDRLLAAGDRTMAIRASVDLLCDHIAEIGATASEFSLFESEVQEVQQSMEEAGGESSGLGFESESLREAINEADQDMERLTSLLVERRGKQSRGH